MKRVSILLISIMLIMCGCSNTSDVECYCCEHYINSDNAKTIDDEYYCDRCYFNTQKCYSCGKHYKDNVDAQYLNYCYDCIHDESKMFFCVECGVCNPIYQKYELYGENYCANCVVELAFGE